MNQKHEVKTAFTTVLHTSTIIKPVRIRLEELTDTPKEGLPLGLFVVGKCNQGCDDCPHGFMLELGSALEQIYNIFSSIDDDPEVAANSFPVVYVASFSIPDSPEGIE